LWQRALDGKGYGSVSNIMGKKSTKAHCIAYRLLVGEVPEGLELDHLCRNPRCCNPDHLDPVTHAVNMSRGAHAMKTHCKHGHEYTPENTYVNPRGSRECRVCIRDRMDRFKARRAPAA
jgi:hypothetical protein